MSYYWDKIKEIVDEKSLSWYAIAKKCGINETTLTHARVSDKPMNWENTCRLAVGLSIDLNELNELRK